MIYIFILFSILDVKRLADKEDWVVDNKGITSLVRIIQFNPLTLLRKSSMGVL